MKWNPLQPLRTGGRDHMIQDAHRGPCYRSLKNQTIRRQNKQQQTVNKPPQACLMPLCLPHSPLQPCSHIYWRRVGEGEGRVRLTTRSAHERKARAFSSRLAPPAILVSTRYRRHVKHDRWAMLWHPTRAAWQGEWVFNRIKAL